MLPAAHWHVPTVRPPAVQLDKASWVLNDSTGFWLLEPVADRPGYVRVWFYVTVQLASLVPGFVVGLVSRLGLKKATSWIGQLDARGS